MIKIMFVCTGNICRSAMAEGMMKKLIKENNINAKICSCGTYAQTGDYATYNAIDAMKQYDVDIKNHRATNIRDSKIKEMDLILCATQNHKQMVNYLYPELKEKVYTMKEYAGKDNNGEELDIEDPWGYDLNVYYNCAIQIKKCLEETVKKIKKQM